MIGLFVAQLGVPILLVVWLLAFPPRSHLGLGIQILGSLLLVAAISEVGLWLFPPWWLPRAAAVGVALAGAWLALAGRRHRSALPSRAAGWLSVALFAASAATGGYALARVRAASRLPEPWRVVDLAFPLAAGRYLVVNGGAWEMINAHRASMDTTIVRLRPWRGNGHAVDIVGLGAWGLRATGVLPEDPRLYAIYGREVLAPCSGVVVTAVNDAPDMPVPREDRERMSGNHVILDCAGVHVVLAHFQPGSVLTHQGEQVQTGQPIARVGNSGLTSEPHLHIHAQRPGRWDQPMSGDPLPVRLGERYLVRGDRLRIPIRP